MSATMFGTLPSTSLGYGGLRVPEKRKTRQVRFPAELLDLADSIAPTMGKSTAEYLMDILWPILRRDATRAGERLIKAGKAKDEGN